MGKRVEYLRSFPKEQRKGVHEWKLIIHRDPCSYCGHVVRRGQPKKLPSGHRNIMEADHIDALSVSSEHRWENLTSACRRCNTEKGSLPLLQALLKT